LTDKQAGDLVLNGKTNVLKGFKTPDGTEKKGCITWNDSYQLVLE
jgi:DNA topoisomerase-3